MIKLVSVHTETGEVSYTMSPAEPSQYADITEMGDSTLIKIEGDMLNVNLDLMTWKIDRDPQWLARTQRPSSYYDWQLSSNSWVLNSSKLMLAIRNERGSRLLACDWTQVSDTPLTDSKKAEWVTYRQALRDAPSNNSSVTSLDDVAWPTPPA